MSNKRSKKGRIEYAEKVEEIKRLALIAMFSDDDLMQTLVLKGGNAMDLIYDVGHRASRDLDFSMKTEFPEKVVDGFRDRVERLLQETFRPKGFEVFDVTFETKPKLLKGPGDPSLAFWGGYQILFKVIRVPDAEAFGRDREQMRKGAFVLGKANSPKFSIEISKYEYCDPKQEHEIDGYTIYVYSPEMIVAEKLRAICQKTDEFAEIVYSESKGERARDFVDICALIDKFGIDLAKSENRRLLRNVFDAKKVPTDILSRLDEYRELHRTGFSAVVSTVKEGVQLSDFDYYFNRVLELAKKLHALGIE